MTKIKINNLICADSEPTLLLKKLSKQELESVSGGKVWMVSCNTDGTNTYTDGNRTWKRRRWWIQWH